MRARSDGGGTGCFGYLALLWFIAYPVLFVILPVLGGATNGAGGAVAGALGSIALASLFWPWLIGLMVLALLALVTRPRQRFEVESVSPDRARAEALAPVAPAPPPIGSVLPLSPAALPALPVVISPLPRRPLTPLLAVLAVVLLVAGAFLAGRFTVASSGLPEASTPAAAAGVEASGPIHVAASPPAMSTVTLPVVGCLSAGAGDGPGPTPAEQAWFATLPVDQGAAFAFYGVGETLVLAPRGWTCAAVEGADGASWITISDPSDPHAVVEADGAAAWSSVVAAACPFFPAAATIARQQGNPDWLSCTVPAGERVRRLDAQDVEFTDPAGIAGTGTLSGGPNAVVGIVHYENDRGGSPVASTLSCALPADREALCGPILDEFVQRPF